MMPTDGTELGLAWAKGGYNHMGMSVKRFDEYTAVFMTAVNLPAHLWRNLARYAGAHVYSESNDVLVADSSIVALHSIQSGAKRIRLPGTSRVRDVITGREIGSGLREIVFDLVAPETRVFLLSEQ
jgi:hypothetical protein